MIEERVEVIDGRLHRVTQERTPVYDGWTGEQIGWIEGVRFVEPLPDASLERERKRRG